MERRAATDAAFTVRSQGASLGEIALGAAGAAAVSGGFVTIFDAITARCCHANVAGTDAGKAICGQSARLADGALAAVAAATAVHAAFRAILVAIRAGGRFTQQTYRMTKTAGALGVERTRRVHPAAGANAAATGDGAGGAVGAIGRVVARAAKSGLDALTGLRLASGIGNTVRRRANAVGVIGTNGV